jgi:hypothetical protein
VLGQSPLRQPPRHWPPKGQGPQSPSLGQTQRCPTCRLPSSNKSRPGPVARNRSRPLTPLQQMAQVSI